MFDPAGRELANQLDIDGIPACSLCLWELAWEIYQARQPSMALVARTVAWTWPEIKDSIERAVVRARMQELLFAEEALRELEEEKWRSGFVHVVVCRLARRLADEIPGDASV